MVMGFERDFGWFGEWWAVWMMCGWECGGKIRRPCSSYVFWGAVGSGMRGLFSQAFWNIAYAPRSFAYQGCF